LTRKYGIIYTDLCIAKTNGVTRVFNGHEIILYSLIIAVHSNLPISKFSRPCNEFTSVWSTFPYNRNSKFEYV